LATCTLPLWARYMDRVHIAQFRARSSWLWIVDQTMNWIGAATGMLGLIAVARVIQGTVRGGGLLAWQLGHNDFANRRMVALYMGMHVTLTGVRGAIVPFVGSKLWEGFSGLTVPLVGWRVPAFAGLGPHVFAVSLSLVVVGALGYNLLNYQMRRAARKAEAHTAA